MCRGSRFCGQAYREVVRGLRLAGKSTLTRSEFDMCIFHVNTDPTIRRYVIMVVGWCALTRASGFEGSPPCYHQACLK